MQPHQTAGEGVGGEGAQVLDAFWALMLPFIIIFGLRFGVFTPTEAAVVAAVYSLIVAMFIYRELKKIQAGS